MGSHTKHGWSGIGAAFSPVILCSLFWKGTTRAGAIAGMLAGFAVTVLWALVLKQRFYDLYEMVPGFAAGLIVTIAVSLFTKPPENAAEEMDGLPKALTLATGLDAVTGRLG